MPTTTRVSTSTRVLFRSFTLALASGIALAAANGPWFRDAAGDTGLRFTHVNGASGKYYLPEIMGAGAALVDIDGDGDLDVYVLQGGSLEKGAGKPSTGHRLFRNDLSVDASGRRTLRFVDITEGSGTALTGYGMGVAAGDYDGDGDLDLYVTHFGPNVLLRNEGNGRFADVTEAAGVADDTWSASAAFFDYDRDGDLDLYVAHYLDFTLASNKICADSLGAPDYCGPRSFKGLPDRLFRNEGNGRFTDVTEAAGITRAYGPGLGVVAADFNRDGWLDVYVANDASANQLWINQHDGTFADEGLISGTALNAAGLPEGSMGIAAGDPDGDGDDDIFVTNLVNESHVFYRNGGAADFDDARSAVGLGAPTAAFTGFGADWFDYDNDGALDLFVTNGAVNIIEEQRGQPVPFRQRNLLFHNATDGFREVGAQAGPAVSELMVGRGAAFGDVDNDGDIDILVTENGGPARLLVNDVARGRSLQIAVQGTHDNRHGLGARVAVTVKGGDGRPRTIWRRVRSDGSYLSASDPRVHVGLGEAGEVEDVTVYWPSGRVERWGSQKAGIVTLTQGTGEAVKRETGNGK